MNLKFLDHIVIIVKNINATAKFYSAFLGDPIQLDRWQVVYKLGYTKIFFCLPYGKYKKYDKDRTGLNHLAFGVRTILGLKSLERKLKTAKIKNSGIKVDKHGGKEFIWFDDPNGIRLEFYLRKTS